MTIKGCFATGQADLWDGRAARLIYTFYSLQITNSFLHLSRKIYDNGKYPKRKIQDQGKWQVFITRAGFSRCLRVDDHVHEPVLLDHASVHIHLSGIVDRRIVTVSTNIIQRVKTTCLRPFLLPVFARDFRPAAWGIAAETLKRRRRRLLQCWNGKPDPVADAVSVSHRGTPKNEIKS